MKPASIKKFDMLYLAALIALVLSVVLNLDAITDLSETEAALAGQPSLGAAGVLMGLGLVTLLALVFWFLISRLRIEMLKWLLALVSAYLLISVIAAMGSVPLASIGFEIAMAVLLAAATYFLFQSDAKEWFAAKRGGDNSE